MNGRYPVPLTWQNWAVRPLQFDDLPRWKFTVVEFSPGGYRVQALRDGGISGEGTGVDSDALLDDFKRWAHEVERGLSKPEQRQG